jgi:potassium-transporting ATPase KdpC subunit
MLSTKMTVMKMKNQVLIAFKFLIVMIILTGAIYPLLMTSIAQIGFAYKANGSLIKKDGIIIGSELIGQKFNSDRYFWTRPSASDYNAVPSGASHYRAINDSLLKQVTARRKKFASDNNISDLSEIPNEMIFSSGSGLDPHIPPKAASLQIDRIAKTRKLNSVQKGKLNNLVKSLTEPHQLLILGEDRVNVLKLNIELDKLFNDTTNNK